MVRLYWRGYAPIYGDVSGKERIGLWCETLSDEMLTRTGWLLRLSDELRRRRRKRTPRDALSVSECWRLRTARRDGVLRKGRRVRIVEVGVWRTGCEGGEGTDPGCGGDGPCGRGDLLLTVLVILPILLLLLLLLLRGERHHPRP